MDFDYAALGRRIKRERGKRGWTQAELAAKTNISDSHISAIERGYTDFSVKYLVRLANTFEMPSDALLYDEIYSHDINCKYIDDIINDCNPNEIKVLADCLSSIKDALRKHAISATDN